MPNGNASMIWTSWVRDMDGKIDKLLEGMVRMETKADNQNSINHERLMNEVGVLTGKRFISEFKQKDCLLRGAANYD